MNTQLGGEYEMEEHIVLKIFKNGKIEVFDEHGCGLGDDNCKCDCRTVSCKEPLEIGSKVQWIENILVFRRNPVCVKVGDKIYCR